MKPAQGCKLREPKRLRSRRTARSEPDGHVKTIHPNTFFGAVIKVRIGPVAIVTDLRAYDEHVVEVMAQANRVAGEVAARALAKARFIAIPLVADSKVVIP